MTIGEQIIASLEDFADKLERGELITCSTITRCICNERRERKGNPKCEQCGGRGWLIEAKTLFGKDDE